MLLLNLIYADPPWAYKQRFTFQYASIKPMNQYLAPVLFRSFTFQYASIKPTAYFPSGYLELLFTFQYASIKPIS